MSSRHLLPLLLLLPGALLASCGSSKPLRDPTGEPFPAVTGQALSGEQVELPGPPEDRPLLLLVGYEMDAQFDLDRWILGLLQAETPARILEVPTIPGMVPGLFAGSIDDGMRSGIPDEDWGQVVTVYGDGARRIQGLTGNDGSRNGRILLLDHDGRVAWFHDRGYSAGKLLELDARARSLAAPQAP